MLNVYLAEKKAPRYFTKKQNFITTTSLTIENIGIDIWQSSFWVVYIKFLLKKKSEDLKIINNFIPINKYIIK